MSKQDEMLTFKVRELEAVQKKYQETLEQRDAFKQSA